MDPFVAEIRMFACNFAPRGWALCNGQIMSISQNTALFSLLGVNYGGNGTNTFGLPNLQARAAMHAGTGPGLSSRSLGDTGGQTTVTLTSVQMPAHSHTLNAKTPGNNAAPAGLVWGNPGGRPAPNFYANAPGTPQAMAPQAVSAAGGGQPHNNLMPYQVVNFCIALEGVYPSRP